MDKFKRFWEAFKDVAILFSFIVNFVLLVVLIVISVPALQTTFALKTGLVEPLLSDLDAAFVGLGDATIDATIDIDEQLPIEFDLPLDETLPVEFDLVLQQHTTVVLQEPVPLIGLPAQFNLPGGGGVINGNVSLSLPAGMRLPVSLDLVVPVSQTVPVQLLVPVSQTIPVRMAVPVHIPLGESGLNPVVYDLRAAIRPTQQQIQALPDGIGLPE